MMTEKHHQNRSIEKTVRDIQKASPSYAAGKASNTNIYYHWSKEFWSLERSGQPGILPARRRPVKLGTCVVRPGYSKKPLRNY